MRTKTLIVLLAALVSMAGTGAAGYWAGVQREHARLERSWQAQHRALLSCGHMLMNEVQ